MSGLLPGLLRIVAMAALLAAAGCGPGPAAGERPVTTTEPPGPAVGADFPVRKGETVRLATPNLSVAYPTLVDDSRCKPGHQCVWEGDATIRVTVDQGGGPEALELHSNPKFTTQATTGKYRITLVSLDIDGVVATLRVTEAG